MSATDSAADLVRRWLATREERDLDDLAPDGAPTCGDEFHSCLCGRPPHDDGSHACRCGGAWTADHEVLRLPERIADGPDAGQPIPPSGFNADDFDRALGMGMDPWMAAVCATPPRMAEKGPIEYRTGDQ